MNQFLEARLSERVHRLALGLETIDAGRGTRVAHPLHVIIDEVLQGLDRPWVDRHPSCLHALLYTPGLRDQVPLRFFEAAPPFGAHRHGRRATDYAGQMRAIPRRFVPRRIRYPLLTLAAAEAGETALRVRRPLLFPGAAYDIDGGMTGVRGRVERAGQRVRWTRITARLPGSATVVARAHGDDRGEFLLLLPATAGTLGDLEDPIVVELTVDAGPPPPAPLDPTLPERDPWWDLPVEEAAPVNPVDPAADPVSAGEALPGGYGPGVTRLVSLPLGRIHSETAALVIP